MLSVQPAFLRRLDLEGVVEPTRSNGGQRRYSQSQIYTIERVAGLASEGLTLAGIRRILALEAEITILKDELKKYKASTSSLQP